MYKRESLICAKAHIKQNEKGLKIIFLVLFCFVLKFEHRSSSERKSQAISLRIANRNSASATFRLLDIGTISCLPLEGKGDRLRWMRWTPHKRSNAFYPIGY